MRYEVTDDDTASALGSGDVPVLGTPRLIAWLEAATVVEAAPRLADGQTTVGAAIRVRHRRPTPVGGTIDVYATLTTEGDRLTFDVSAIDGDGHYVADGEIDRVVVERAAFG
ncbi:thioesterase family protein [Actinomycetospora aeridis]|uniref:Thioesterase n=1 Tax=Actinomycetospora aeridis TaxID=3129231 RepID=A0ABU8NBG8_9PSEU